MAMIVSYTEINRSSLNTIPKKSGQLIYCKDSRESFYDASDGTRIQMGDIIYLNTEEERTALLAPLTDKIYFVRSTSKLYKYNGTAWILLNSVVDFENSADVNEYSQLVIGTMVKEGTKRAPRTLTTAIYRAADGVVLDTILTSMAGDIASKSPSNHDHNSVYQPKGNYLTSESDPTVPAWAKQPTKPSYNASEVGARPDNWMPSAIDVGADPAGSAAGVQRNLDTVSNVVSTIQGKIDSGEIGGAQVIQNLTIASGGWVNDAALGLFKYTISDARITAAKVVNVNFNLASISFAEFFGVYGTTESFAGYAEIYADVQPTQNLVADVVIL